MMARIGLFLALWVGAAGWLAAPAMAQTTDVLVVATCGNQSFNTGATTAPLTVDTTGKLCDLGGGGSVAGFTPNGSYATLTATGSSARAALPTGTVVVAYNTGTSAVSCVLGNGSVVATTNEDQIVAGGFFSYTVGANADLACIDQTGSASNVVVLSGGSGIASGAGGGGVSGSLGNNTDGVAAVTTGLLGTDAYNYVFNGTTWDRAVGLTTGAFGSPSASVLSVQNNDPCSYAAKSSAAINVSAAGTTNPIPASGSTTIYVCGYEITVAPSATSADTVQFEYGTGSSCTSPTVLTGTLGDGNLTTAVQSLDLKAGLAGQTVWRTAPGAALCYIAAGTTVKQEGYISFVQQQ